MARAGPGRDVRAPILLAALLVLAAIPLVGDRVVRADSSTDLVVGEMDEMKTRNPLPVVASDLFTRDVLDRVYDRPLRTLPDGTLLAYVAKGVDANGDGVFESSEHNEWRKDPTPDPRNVTVYYDFNGVEWHDGTQVDVWDLLFSYHVESFDAQFNGSLTVLFAAGASSSYEDSDRQLEISIAAKNWEGESNLPGSASLRVALRFRPTEPFVHFYDETLAPVLLPVHIWSRTGGGRHPDFGCALWVPPSFAAARGVPACGNADPATWGRGIGSGESVPGSTPYAYATAEGWEPTDADVVGSGPFRLDTWVRGVYARAARYERFYTGVDNRGTTATADDIVYDAELARVIRRPTIEGILFKVYKTRQLGVFALQNGEIDFYHANMRPDFVPDLLKVSEIAIEGNAEPGLTYIGYNLRRDPWGPPTGSGDSAGYWLRQAISHLIDKNWFLGYLLQNLGIVAYGFITPANTFWFNGDIPHPRFDLAEANAILDSPEARASGIGPDPPGACTKDTPAGCRSLPGIGTNHFDVLKAQSDDPSIWDPWSMLLSTLPQVGLNAVFAPVSFGTMLTRMAAHDFDMYLGAWRLGLDPDFLFGVFHSSAAASGENYMGFQNATFDALIEASRRAMDRDTRRGLIHAAHLVVLEARPAEPVFYATNIEAYRQDRYVNWTVVEGTIWNEWSLFRIRPPKPIEVPRVSLSAPSALLARERVSVTARITTPQGIALPGAAVRLSVTAGNLTLGAETGSAVSGTADSRGEVVAEYAAPDVDDETRVLVTATATHPDFAETGQSTTLLYVFPGGTHFLSLTVSLPFGDIVRPGDSLPMRITVRDSYGIAVPDATVTVGSTNTSVLTANPANGTAEGMASVTLTANASLAAIVTASVTVTATKTGYEPTEKAVPVSVVPGAPPTYACADGRIVADPADCTPPASAHDATPVLLAAGIGVGAAIATAVLLWRRRRGTAKP